MRTDENGNPCPATLGEYYDLCMALGGPNAATELLGMHIARDGRDDPVVQGDAQMRVLLMPLLCHKSLEAFALTRAQATVRDLTDHRLGSKPST